MFLDLLHTLNMHLGMKANHCKPLRLLITISSNRIAMLRQLVPDKCKIHTFICGQAKGENSFPVEAHLSTSGSPRAIEAFAHGLYLLFPWTYTCSGCGEKAMHANSYKAVSMFLSLRPDCAAGKAMKGILCF